MPPQNQAPKEIDFSDVAKAPPAAGPRELDFSDITGGTSSVSGPDRTSPAYWDQLKDKYGLPRNYDLAKTLFENYTNNEKLKPGELNQVNIDKLQQAWDEAHPKEQTPTSFLGRSWDEVKNIFKGLTTEGTGALFGKPMESPTVAGFTPPQNPLPAVQARGKEFAEHPAAATGATAVDVAAALAPLGVSKLLGSEGASAAVERALGRKLSLEEVGTVRSPGTNQPALQVTNGEVLNHAADMGIKLTPGQALEDPAATNVQKMGTTAMVGGKDLHLALRAQRYAFAEEMNKLGARVDPTSAGMTEENAGHAIQKDVQKALDTKRAAANAAYNQVSAQQQDLTGNLRSLYGLADEKQFEKITDPRTGQVTQRPIYQPPAVAAALKDIQDAPVRLGEKPSIASMRSLRTEFWEKANDYTGNIPDSARALYKQAASAVDNSIMEASTGTPFEKTFRGANAQWKDLQAKYNEPGQPLYKVLQENNPEKIVNQLQNASPDDIRLLRQETGDGPAVQALRRQVLHDIQNHKFSIGVNGMGGYNDAYLKSLFGDQMTKELYLKGDVAHRISYDANPSGSASGISVLEQGGSIKNQPKLSLFARLSMPRDAKSYLPDVLQGRPTAFPANAPPAGAAPAAVSITPPRIGPYLGIRSMINPQTNERAQNQ